MPKKTSEEIREKVVALRKSGATYTQIEKQVISPETGEPLARPTLIKILKEAGLTTPKGPRQVPAASSATQARPTSAPSASSNGVSDFMPKNQPKRKVYQEFVCEHCGMEFVGPEDEEPPETCPECGH